MTTAALPVRAIQFPGLSQVVVTEVPEPDAPGPGEVLLRTDYIGICGTDLHVLHGKHPWVRPPLITGHEVVATVLKAGPASGSYRTGQRVIVNPLVTCGQCRACRTGRANHCEAAKVMGFRLPGAGRTHLVVSSAQLHRVPDNADAAIVVLAEPLAVGIHAADRADDLETVLIIGGGTIGLCVLLGVLMRGASKVCLAEPVASKRALAQRLGAHEVVTPEALGHMAGYTAVFDCVASQATLNVACRSAIGGGTVVVVGVAESDRAFPLPRLQRFEINLIGSGMYRPGDIDAAIVALVENRIDGAALVTAIRPLAAAPAAYEEARQPDSVKVLIDMS